MKKLFILFAVVFVIQHGFCANNVLDIEQVRDISLNPQDAPIFYDDNPLTGMKSFVVITSFYLKDEEKQKRIQQSIDTLLNDIGEVIHLKDNDMRGFGAGNVFLIQIDNVTGCDGSEMPISRVSLSIETSVTLDKTDVKTFPMVWSINTFLHGNVSSCSANNMTNAIQKLVDDFDQSYQYSNPEKRPVFYIYD